MYLTDLIRSAGLSESFDISENFHSLDITGIENDSRQIHPGQLFAALPGTRFDGTEFIASAIEAGAVAVLMEAGADLPDGVDPKKTVILKSANIRRDVAFLAAAFYSAQPAVIIGVTGTNGKSSCVNFTRQIWELLGYKAASLGTIGLQQGEALVSGSLTTPDAVRLHRDIDGITRGGVTHLAVEASSHGLDQHRLDGLKLKAAGFTNLTHDHLDYHKTMENYRAAKARLFSELLPEEGTAVLNADSPEYEYYKAVCDKRKQTVLTYGYKGQVLKIVERFPHPGGQDIRLSVFGTEKDLALPLVGEFQLMNVLCSALMALSGVEGGLDSIDQVLDVLPCIKSVKGRLEQVPGHPEGAAIYVDYAHTPDALETVLKALRPHTNARLICVVGCGGDRDRKKRPMMGEISSKLADVVIVTDDNPRTEDPALIRQEILNAAPGAREIGSRGQAIEEAVGMLRSGDVLLIAGKGHEQGQIIGEEILPFDDVEHAAQALKKPEKS